MNWFNVKRLFVRELLSQLRDRRTLFTTVLLPVMIYPVLGLVMMQVAQFVTESKSNVVLVGEAAFEGLPQFVNPNGEEEGLVTSQDTLLTLIPEEFPEHATLEGVQESLQQRLDSKEFDAALVLLSLIHI